MNKHKFSELKIRKMLGEMFPDIISTMDRDIFIKFKTDSLLDFIRKLFVKCSQKLLWNHKASKNSEVIKSSVLTIGT